MSFHKTKRVLFLTFSMVLANHSFIAAAEEWPNFHGPGRTNRSKETGLLKVWPEGGPRLLWTATGLGEGYSSVSIADGRIYSAGTVDGQTVVFAFDNNGKLIWKTANGPSWVSERAFAKGYQGSRSTPTFSDGLVFHLSETGHLAAYEAISGKEKWSIDCVEKYNGIIPKFGFAESVTIEGDRLYCNVAGKKIFGICLNKNDGSLLWTYSDIHGEGAYNSSIIADVSGYHQLISMSSECVFGVDTKVGKLLWKVPIKNDRENNIADPIVYKSHVFVSSGYERGSKLIKLNTVKGAIETTTVWDKKIMDNHHGGVILHEGFLYGAGHKIKGWFCLDAMTGMQKWNAKGKGALTFADEMLYCLEENGTIKLVKASPDKYEEMGSFKVPSGGKGLYWAHPVVCGGRLYVRHADKLFAYAIK